MNLKKKITIIFGLQFSQLLRFITFLLISIFLTKINSHSSTIGIPTITQNDIGDYELMMLIAGALSFFWVTGIIQSFLPLYNNNPIFEKRKDDRQKSPEIFNTFLLLSFFNIVFAILIWILKDNILVYKDLQQIPHIKLLVLFFLLSNITSLIEYIYYVRNRPYPIVYYSFIMSIVLLLAFCIPIYIGWGIESGIWGLIGVSAFRILWLFALLLKYAEFRFSLSYIRCHLRLGFPLIGSNLLSGSSQYVDGFIASWTTDSAKFALFRYGAKELPFATSMSAGLNNGLLTEFSNPENIRQTLYDIKKKSLRMMHYIFPLTIVIMIFSKWIFGNMFSPSFYRSADVFMVYLLMVISRLLFPQTILIGLKKTRIVFWASLIEIVLKIIAILLLMIPYGIVGIALGTVLVHILEKIVMIWYNYSALHIAPKAYIPMSWFLFYSLLLIGVFVLIDHRILFII